MKHHISTVYVIGTVITAVSVICLFAISKAIQLQSLSEKHRDFIRNELFIIEEEIWELKLAGKGDERINDLSSAKALLQQVDESINFGLVTYSNQTKIKILKVPKNIIMKYGAVSHETCFFMVKNLNKISKTNIAVSRPSRLLRCFWRH